MSERTALTLVLTAMLLAITIAFAAVRVLHGPDAVIVIVYIVVLGVGADTCSRVSLHYLDKQSTQRRRR